MNKTKLLLSTLASFILLLIFKTSLYAQDNYVPIPDTVKAMLMENKYEESLTVLDSILVYDSTNVNAYYYQSICYQYLSDYRKASAALKKALIYKPDDINIMVSLGNNLSASGQLSDAENILSKAFLLDSTNNRLLISFGKVLMQKHDWVEALKIYNVLIQIDSSNSFYYEQAGKCNILLMNRDAAIVNLQIAHRLNSLNELTIMELSNLYYAKKQFISAMRIINDGLAVYPLSCEFWTRKGDIFLGMKNYTGALSCYDCSLKLGDSSFTNLKNSGLCFYLTGEYDSAAIFLGNAVELNKKDPTSYFYLGASYKEMNNYNDAIQNFFAALKLLKNDYLPGVYTQLASSYYSLKDYRKALYFYKDALEEAPRKFQLNLYIASVYERLYKDKSVAMRYYKKFLADSAEADKKLVKYAKDKLAAYTEEKFMNQKR